MVCEKPDQSIELNSVLHQQKCNLCGGSSTPVNTLFLLGLINCTTYKCDNCGAFFRFPLPNEQAVAQYYASRYFRYPDKIERTMAQRQGQWILQGLKQYGIASDTVNYVEVGAGRGWLVSFMQNQGTASAVGYEPDSASVAWGQNTFGIDLQKGSWMDALQSEDLPKKGVFLLSLVHVLEHLHSPLEVLQELKKCYHDPYIFIEVPDARYEGPVMELDTFPKSSMGQHFWSFTEQTLSVVLKRTGFSVIAMEKDGDFRFWNNRLTTLRIWKDITDLYRGWNCNEFNLKQGAISSLTILCRCLFAGLKTRMLRLQGHGCNRLDLPIIRVLAKAVPPSL